MTWTLDIESVLERIRTNSVQMSGSHKQKYFFYKKIIKWFKIPTIVLSSIGSVASVGLTEYIDQAHISAITCGLALFVSVLNSVEMFLKINEMMEQELEHSKLYYNLSVNIQKTLLLDPDNRSDKGPIYLEKTYSQYIKLMECSNLLSNVQDRFMELPKNKKPTAAEKVAAMAAKRGIPKTKKSDGSSSSGGSDDSPTNTDELERTL
jgi:hypothetical protein